MISYTDLFGGQRAKLVPAQAIADMQKDGAGFAGFATWLDLTPAHPDLLAVPDAAVGHPAARGRRTWPGSPPTAVMEDKLVEQAPAQRAEERRSRDAAKEGLRVKTGVEAEFFSSSRRRHARSPTTTTPPTSPATTSRR